MWAIRLCLVQRVRSRRLNFVLKRPTVFACRGSYLLNFLVLFGFLAFVGTAIDTLGFNARTRLLLLLSERQSSQVLGLE